jgi:hypothetical protein
VLIPWSRVGPQRPTGLATGRRAVAFDVVATTTPPSSTGRPDVGRSLVTGARASRSTIALKLLMAASGVIFILFVLVHMYGNLKAFAGHDAFGSSAWS